MKHGIKEWDNKFISSTFDPITVARILGNPPVRIE
jgi:hypothetical protein